MRSASSIYYCLRTFQPGHLAFGGTPIHEQFVLKKYALGLYVIDASFLLVCSAPAISDVGHLFVIAFLTLFFFRRRPQSGALHKLFASRSSPWLLEACLAADPRDTGQFIPSFPSAPQKDAGLNEVTTLLTAGVSPLAFLPPVGGLQLL